MLAQGKVMAFVATMHSEQARAFYEGVLGLRVVSDDEFALVLDANGTTVRVVHVREFVAAPYTALGWEVADIVTSVRRLRERGVVFERYASFEQDNLGIWTSPGGARVAWFKDPDGNVLSVTQR
ncbi:MAG: VOC family protein [Myxococcota bacterium]|nr:VOC family protein [Myxococcota bacterium]